MLNSQNRKIMAISPSTLIVGVDIAKKVQWARFIDYRGVEVSKVLKFNNTTEGFKSIVFCIKNLCSSKGFDNAVVGMESTGNYWKPFANYLKQKGITIVNVGTYQTKMAKALDDNSPTKSDSKDALTIAKLIKDGRYNEVYMPNDVYAELRVLSGIRIQLNDKQYAVKNRIHNILDEYFPEFTSVFKNPFKGKTSLHILRTCAFPEQVIALGEDGVLAEIKKAVLKTVGRKKAAQLVKAANNSIGVSYGLSSVKIKLTMLMDEFEMIARQLDETETAMEQALMTTGYGEIVLSVPGIGVVSAANVFGETGDMMRFENERQIHRLAGYNLTECSSGNSKSGTSISKRGRKNLRSILFQIAMVMVATNKDMMAFYKHLKERKENPLKRKQALVVIAKKVITILFNLVKKKSTYDDKLVFGKFRIEQINKTFEAEKAA